MLWELNQCLHMMYIQPLHCKFRDALACFFSARESHRAGHCGDPESDTDSEADALCRVLERRVAAETALAFAAQDCCARGLVLVHVRVIQDIVLDAGKNPYR